MIKNPVSEFSKKDIDRFWNKVKKSENCWLWTDFPSGDNGYGRFHRKYEYWPAHRISWWIHGNEIPSDKHVLHRCDTPLCVNPEHLFLGTQRENILDMMNKNRIATGEKNGNSKLREEQIISIRNMFINGFSKGNISKIFHITRRTVKMIVEGQTWKQIDPLRG